MNGIEWLIIVAVIAIVISFSIAVEGDSVAAGLFGVFVIICFLGLVFLDGGVRGANLGCAEISSPPGLLANMPYDTLAKAAREGRVMARKSGATYLTTQRAVEYALETGTLRK